MYATMIEVSDLFTSLEMISWLVDEVGIENYDLTTPVLTDYVHAILHEQDRYVYSLVFNDRNKMLLFELKFAGGFRTISDLDSYVKKYVYPTAGSRE